MTPTERAEAWALKNYGYPVWRSFCCAYLAGWKEALEEAKEDKEKITGQDNHWGWFVPLFAIDELLEGVAIRALDEEGD